LSGNKIKDEGLLALTNGRYKNLTDLNIGDNEITRKGV
jgi:hypothetical protein